MDLLPTPDQRTALLDALSRLIEAHGFETFVRAPLLEPSSTYFPDVWEPSKRGVRALSLRLLAYAGLHEVDASVELYGEARPTGTWHEGTAAWFAGIDADGTCRFGSDRKQLALGDSIVGTMCHEIAHAFRHHHGLVGPHRQVEEEDTDVTTIYLGFGILTTNNAYRFRKTGEMRGGVIRTSWSTTHTGYLSPQAMAFLLAAQAVIRGLTKQEVKNVASLLETNQAAFFRASHTELARSVDALGIPPREVWPDERTHRVDPLREDARFLATDPDPDAAAANEDGDGPEPGTQAIVFRVPTTHGSPLFAATASAFIVGFAGARFLGGDHLGWIVGAMLVASVVGARLGRGRRVDLCSNPHCEAEIPPATDRCPKCRGPCEAASRAPLTVSLRRRPSRGGRTSTPSSAKPLRVVSAREVACSSSPQSSWGDGMHRICRPDPSPDDGARAARESAPGGHGKTRRRGHRCAWGGTPRPDASRGQRRSRPLLDGGRHRRDRGLGPDR